MTKIQNDGNQNTEYKEAWRDEYLTWICALLMPKDDCGGTLVSIIRPTVSPYKVDENILDTTSHVVKDVVKGKDIETNAEYIDGVNMNAVYVNH